MVYKIKNKKSRTGNNEMKIENNNAIPIVEETEQIDVFGYSDEVADTGVVVANSDERARLMKLNLSPYSSNSQFSTLNSQLDFRFLYTGREYNIETGDYYYRMRMMDSSVGRFNSKDPILYLNLYRYVENNPLGFRDKLGTDPTWDSFLESWDMNFELNMDFFFGGFSSVTQSHFWGLGTGLFEFSLIKGLPTWATSLFGFGLDIGFGGFSLFAGASFTLGLNIGSALDAFGKVYLDPFLFRLQKGLEELDTSFINSNRHTPILSHPRFPNGFVAY